MSFLFVISTLITALLTAVGTVSFYIIGFIFGLIAKCIDYFRRIIHGDIGG